MKSWRRIFFYFALLLVSISFAARSADETHPTTSTETVDEKPPPPDPVKKIGPGRYRIGCIEIDAKQKEIVFDGRFNMRDGLIEVMISTEFGKLHEALIEARIRPLNLHTALLLLGLKPGRNPAWIIPEEPEYRWSGWDAPPGDMLDVWLEWKENDEPRRARLETMIMDRRTSQTLSATPWVFIGSYLTEDGFYAGDYVGSIITNYHDGAAVLDCPLEGGRLDDFSFVNTPAIPKVGTPVKVFMQPAIKKEEEENQ